MYYPPGLRWFGFSPLARVSTTQLMLPCMQETQRGGGGSKKLVILSAIDSLLAFPGCQFYCRPILDLEPSDLKV